VFVAVAVIVVVVDGDGSCCDANEEAPREIEMDGELVGWLVGWLVDAAIEASASNPIRSASTTNQTGSDRWTSNATRRTSTPENDRRIGTINASRCCLLWMQ